MSQNENARDIDRRDNEPEYGKAGSGEEQNEVNEEFILEGDLSGDDAQAGDAEKGINNNDREREEMTVDVVQAVSRLEELDRLLGELNFRELIMQFGKLQGEVELIRYELDSLQKESVRVRESVSGIDGLKAPEGAEMVEIIGELRERIYSLADGVRKVISQQEILKQYVTGSREWMIERSGEVLSALTQIRESQRSRMEMVASLNEMLESDTPNEKLASAALEFAVLMRELDGDEGLDKLDAAISEVSGFRDEVAHAEKMILGDEAQLDNMKNNIGLVEEIPNMAGELLSFLAMVSRTLDKIAAGWNEPQSPEKDEQEEMPLAESDE